MDLLLTCLKFGLIVLLPVIVPVHQGHHRSEQSTVFSLHYTVDRMTHEKRLSGSHGSGEDIVPLPKVSRYALTYQVERSGDFFIEIHLLASPWESVIPHETTKADGDLNISRMVITPGSFKAFDPDGEEVFQQSIQDFSMPEGLFSDGFDPLSLRDLLISDENPANRVILLTEKGGIELDNGFISIQSCGQTGPLRISCEPGVCSRVVYDPSFVRPVLAEHSLAGEPPFYVQYFKWSPDGKRLEKSFEREVFKNAQGVETVYETVSHFHNFSLKH